MYGQNTRKYLHGKYEAGKFVAHETPKYFPGFFRKSKGLKKQESTLAGKILLLILCLIAGGVFHLINQIISGG